MWSVRDARMVNKCERRAKVGENWELNNENCMRGRALDIF